MQVEPKVNHQNVSILKARLADLGTPREDLELTLNALVLVYADLNTKRSLDAAERMVKHVIRKS